jgi:hypothetical protein
MAIVNRRNAVIGWIVLKLGKTVAKKKGQSAVPTARTGIVAGAAAGVAGIAGALLFWRKKRDTDPE